MKVITRTEWEWDGAQYVAVSVESEDYDGPVAQCKGGSAPKQDPLIGQAAMKQAELADEALNWYQNIYYPEQAARLAEQDELSNEYIRAALAEQARQSQISNEYYARMKDVFYPIEDKLVAESMNAGDAADQERYASRALADTQMSFNRQRNTAERQMLGMGINPNSGVYQNLWAASAPDRALVEVAAQNTARNAAEQLGWAKRMDAAALGRGLPSQQASAAQMALGAGSSALGAGQASFQNFGSTGAGMMGAYGQSGNMWGQAGSTALQGYNQRLQAWQQKQQSKSSALGSIGSAVGMIGGALVGGPLGSAMGSALGGMMGDSPYVNNGGVYGV